MLVNGILMLVNDLDSLCCCSMCCSWLMLMVHDVLSPTCNILLTLRFRGESTNFVGQRGLDRNSWMGAAPFLASLSFIVGDCAELWHTVPYNHVVFPQTPINQKRAVGQDFLSPFRMNGGSTSPTVSETMGGDDCQTAPWGMLAPSFG